jgi:hypothetical protein
MLRAGKRNADYLKNNPEIAIVGTAFALSLSLSLSLNTHRPLIFGFSPLFFSVILIFSLGHFPGVLAFMAEGPGFLL